MGGKEATAAFTTVELPAIMGWFLGESPMARTHAREVEQRATQVVVRLREAGHEALFAGGCVRDRLLGIDFHDIDIATSARPKEVQGLFRRTLAVGEQFGVVIVLDRPGGDAEQQFQVATFRSDGEYLDGRRPQSVNFCEAAEDAKRRDFTINALFWDPVEERLIDHVGGQADIQARLVRAVGDPVERFAEDHLRLLRAARFTARLGFDLDPATETAARAAAPLLSRVSAERVRDELNQILLHRTRRRGFEICDDLGLLEVVLPELIAMQGVEQPPQFHPEGDVWEHTLQLLGHMEAEPTETLAWAGLLHDVGKPATFTMTDRIRFNGHAAVGVKIADDILRRLHFSNRIRERVLDHVRLHLHFLDAQKMRQSKLKRFLRQDGFEELLELHRLDSLASKGDLEAYEFCKARFRELEATAPEDGLRPEPLLRGQDLITLGLQPGPDFKRILTALEDAQLEGQVTTRHEAEDLVRREFVDLFES